MPSLGQKNSILVARFRYLGRENKKSLKTFDHKAAEAALAQIELTIHTHTIGLIAIPPVVDLGDFILSGGTTEPVARYDARPAPTVLEAFSEYLGHLEHVSESHRYTIGVHLRNLKAEFVVKFDDCADQITRRDLEAYLQARRRVRSPATVAKERDTVIVFFRWAVTQSYLDSSPARELIRAKVAGNRPPFRTVAEIEVILARGGFQFAILFIERGSDRTDATQLLLIPTIEYRHAGEAKSLDHRRGRVTFQQHLHRLATKLLREPPSPNLRRIRREHCLPGHRGTPFPRPIVSTRPFRQIGCTSRRPWWGIRIRANVK